MTEPPKPFPSLKDLDETLDFLNGEGMNDLANIVTNEIEARKEFVAWLHKRRPSILKDGRTVTEYELIQEILEALEI